MHRHELIQHTHNLPVFFNSYVESTMLIPSHWHRHIEIIYIKSGSMEVLADQHKLILVPGDMYIVNSEDIHLTRVRDYTEVLLLQIPVEFIQEILQKDRIDRYRTLLTKAAKAEEAGYKTIESCLFQMESLIQNKASGYQFLFNSALNRLLYSLHKDYLIPETSPVTTTDRNRRHLKKAINYINDHYQEPISLMDIASHVALNQAYFCRLFKKYMGYTSMEYLNQVRLVHIYDDLVTTTDTVSEIQNRHGFTNYKVFSRMFKDAYGTTPSGVRK